MRAAAGFASTLEGMPVERVRCSLYGSLADTGKGHGTDHAVMLGLMGEKPSTLDVDAAPSWVDEIRQSEQLTLPGGQAVRFVEAEDLQFVRTERLPRHPNGMKFVATDSEGVTLVEETVYSIGGGFIVNDRDWEAATTVAAGSRDVPYFFTSGRQLLELCAQHGMSIAELTLANESSLHGEAAVRRYLDDIWQAMQSCIERGISTTGTLPGGLKVKRRAKSCHEALLQRTCEDDTDPLATLDWVNLYALAVNEENAAGGRVVTAPTNGAAGVLPAVLKYATQFRESTTSDGVHRFLLTAGAIATLYKRNASLSGADVGCQGEVGVACSMAAAGLTEYLGGTPGQVEFAAEVGMEHNLGLTCDPIGGLVQIPCIERNAMGAVKAINASRMAFAGNGEHHVSLDKVIKTMLATGRDMMAKYKETSRGGLAVNIVEC